MNKNKRISIFFLIIVSLYLFLPVKLSFAVTWNDVWNSVKNTFNNIKNSITGTINTLIEIGKHPGQAFVAAIVWGVTILLRAVFSIVWLLDSLVAIIVDWVSLLSPFREGTIGDQKISPVAVIWNIFKNFSYILIVFSTLLAGFKILFEQEGVAYRLIFTILIVAFIINFSFILVKEAYLMVDRLEKGLTGGCPPNATSPQEEQKCNSKKLGSLIMASMWQKHDPLKLIQEAAKQIWSGQEGEGFSKLLIDALVVFFTNLFLLILAFIMFIILIITLTLVIARYFFILFYAATSSLAIATLVIPESKGTFAELTKGMRQFDNWLNGFIKWLLVVPLFVIMVIIGQIIQEASLSQIGPITTGQELVEFVMILFFMTAWYLVSITTAVRLSGKAGELGKFAAMGSLAGIGMFAARGFLFSKAGVKTAGWLQSAGQSIQSKIGVGGAFGWRSWVSQRIGKPAEEIGEKIIERRYKTEAEAVRTRFNTLEEQLRKETDPQKIQVLTSEIANMSDKYRNVPYVLKTISEDIGRMNVSAFEKLAKDPKALSVLAEPTAPEEVRDKIIDQFDRLPRRLIRDIFMDPNLLDTYSKFSAEVFSKFIEKAGKELSDEDALDIFSNDSLRNYFQNLSPDHPLRRTLNRVSKNLVEASTSRNLDEASLALANLSSGAWRKTGEIDKILRNYNLDTAQALSRAIAMAEKPEIIINSLIGKVKGDPLRVALSKLSDAEIEDLGKKLTPQLKSKLESIILDEIV